MEETPEIENKVNFTMNTNWLFQEPIDFEHKKYVLLAYLKKIDDIINQNKIILFGFLRNPPFYHYGNFVTHCQQPPTQIKNLTSK